ncbi:sporulation protein [Mesobacillus campisalis]|uniref:Sporulation protein n=1 Tax=Mesobacillus campisalis TaxID=1408103 RepID=A0A0M2SXF4_9BACI|nr:CAP domain-containing protein [Mesobacillus campisalis]KKK37300.1 sporulation protein [Mesobacillus campisalis]
MKKKLIFSVAAAAAILASNPAMQADAATIYPTGERKIVYYQTGNINKEQIQELINKYFANPEGFWKQAAQLSTTPATKAPVTPAKQQPAPAKQQPAAPAPAKQQPAAPAPAKQQPAAPAPAKQQPAAPAPAKQQPAAPSSVSAYEQKVVELTNQERAKNGLKPLVLDTELSKVAREKSRDMQAKGYFSHTSPTYGSPFDMMKKYGISYKTAGENIAMGQRSPEEVVKAWMNSEGHRKNILNSNYTHIGVGHIAEGNYWTQMFIGK